MGKQALQGNRSPIVILMHRNGFDVRDVCRLLRVSDTTLRNYIADPTVMRIREVMLLAAMFRVDWIALGYLLSKHKCQVKTKRDKWFMNEVKDNLRSLEDSLKLGEDGDKFKD